MTDGPVPATVATQEEEESRAPGDALRCPNCPRLAQAWCEPHCCLRCAWEPGHHGPMCLGRYPPTLCSECGSVTDDGWIGDEEHADVFWCRRCWEPWLAALPPSGRQLPEDARAPIFVLGLPKCGTTSLQHALESAGYGAVHCYAPKPWGPNPADRFVGHLMERAAAEGRPPLDLLPSWVNAVTQMDCWWIEDSKQEGEFECAHGYFPQMTLLEQLDTTYPHAGFILNLRNAHEWLRSVETYGPLRRILAEADLPGLPGKAGSEDEELLTWFEEHTARVRHHFAGCEAGKFLEISLDEEDHDLKEKLEAFLQVPVEWGHHNRTTWA
eukprot:gnl/TRDRNA2_/TRDRNA2_83155_c0_seq2.p1 gnl/TRDRNA2_/TRDRNA2_83155_c0~~gnl/TRDRNA2_/TRDRNA2_83155_c0_seq2.p1  ORF type:complete len:326 (+),score=41.35 gnl/TRDRNA2_/TRDRNA2_83155_c0_seq2:79-1056(+)